MSPDEAIMLALATGAAARMDPNVYEADRPDIVAYTELVELFSQSYVGVEARMLEVGPGSEERQKLLAEQIRNSGADEDKEVLKQSRRVLREVLERSPPSVIAAFADRSTVSEALEAIDERL